MKKYIIAGFNLSCVGDDRGYSYVESRYGDNLADNAIKSALLDKKNVKRYSFLFRGSDERQYCAPGIDLPVCGFSRSKFGEYKEYHTSADNLKIISNKSLNNSLKVLKTIVDAFETGLYPEVQIKGEPQLSKYNLHPTISQKGIKIKVISVNKNLLIDAMFLHMQMVKIIYLIYPKKLIFRWKN